MSWLALRSQTKKKKDKSKNKSRLEAAFVTLNRNRVQLIIKREGNLSKLGNLKQCKKPVEVRLKFNQEAQNK